MTGILQGDKCITIDGIERSGIFALVNNKVVFELDPESEKYRFSGDVISDGAGGTVRMMGGAISITNTFGAEHGIVGSFVRREVTGSVNGVPSYSYVMYTRLVASLSTDGDDLVIGQLYKDENGFIKVHSV